MGAATTVVLLAGLLAGAVRSMAAAEQVQIASEWASHLGPSGAFADASAPTVK